VGITRLLALSFDEIMPTLIRASVPVAVRSSGPLLRIIPSRAVQVIRRAVVHVGPRRITTVTARSTVVIPINPVRAESVDRPPRLAWDERGWTRQQDGDAEVYDGYYQVGDRSFRGRIKVGRRNRIQAYIHEPPEEIRRHRHHACFQQYGTGTGWYILHWQRAPQNVDEALLYFEQVLDESIHNR